MENISHRFEMRVNYLVNDVMEEIDNEINDEQKMQFLTHIFAKTLDNLASKLARENIPAIPATDQNGEESREKNDH